MEKMSEEIMTAGELMHQQFLPKVTLVDGLLTAGTYILAGTPKIGKSFFVTQLCWCVSEGVPFLGLQTHKSTVLYLALEGGFVLYKSNGQVFLDQTGRDLPSQRYVLQFDPAACLWTLIRCENEPLQEKADPLLDIVDQIIDTSWRGSATEFLELIRQIDPKTSFMPNTLTRRLNSLTKRLMFEKGIEYLCSRRKEKRQILFLRKVTDDDYDANDDTFLALEMPSLPSLASSECSEQQGKG